VSGFVVVPLTSENIVAIWKTVTDKEHLAYPSNIIHTQIAINGRLVFGAYDNFHRDCVFASDRFPKEKLDQLVQSGVIRSYKLDSTVSEVTVGECSIPV